MGSINGKDTAIQDSEVVPTNLDEMNTESTEDLALEDQPATPYEALPLSVESEATTEEEDDEDDEEAEYEDPVIKAVSRYVHSVNDVEDAMKAFVPMALKIEEEQHVQIAEAYKEAERCASDENPANRALSSSMFIKATRKANRYIASQVPRTLVKSLFLNLFSDFDTFTGELLIAIYNKKPELFQSINKSVPLSDIVKCSDIDQLKDRILLEEIETFRRKSYVEQFEILEQKFGLKTIKKFNNWPKFVEATQRRNLFMHCDAIVSEQYMKICKENNCDLGDLEIGDKLEISAKYFKETLDIMKEVAIKLANVLWRKVLPEEKEESDDALHNIVYDCLNEENWNLAILIGDFVRNDARCGKEIMQRINIINLVIAQKFSGNNKAAQKILGTLDWSASILDFRLAVAVLEDNFEDAAELMVRIGKSDNELLDEKAYLEWPLFKDFRQSHHFLTAYEKVFGYSFITKMQENAHEFEKEVDEKQDNMIQEESKLQTTVLDESNQSEEATPSD
ncbi:hypothetical protein ACO14J_000485 [Vibrio parahaemolyticus]|uniref:hypothetical protein n=1 Tax=Vibrio parahaemolyticus TaxID=670 RepID=UPI0004050301|nr:hypothetical protein [Vibrio parahaemolyticus]TOD56066.1 hypothetical protein CGJ62_16985 [Vibrio parahaemolyticus]